MPSAIKLKINYNVMHPFNLTREKKENEMKMKITGKNTTSPVLRSVPSKSRMTQETNFFRGFTADILNTKGLSNRDYAAIL